MMTPYVVFDVATGTLIKAGDCQLELLDAQAGAGQRALPTNLTSVEGIRPLIWELVKVKREERYSAGLTTPFGVLDTTPDSREKILGLFTDAVSRVATGGSKNRNFTKTDETQVTLSSAQLVAVGQLVVDYIDAVHQHSQSLRTQIYAPTVDTVAELLAITIDTGWPGE